MPRRATVTELCGTGEPWKNKAGQGPFTPYRFKVEGENRMVEWSRKEGSAGPQVGDELFGDFVDKGENFPVKYKPAQQQGGGGGRGMTDEDRRRITRSHSQEMSLRYMAAKGIADFKLDDDFRKVIDWFDRDVESVK